MEMKNLRQLMEKVKYKDHRIFQGLAITGIQYDSRKVELGNLFVAVKGFQTDGHKYIRQAFDNGAIAVMVSDEAYCSDDYPWIWVEDCRVALAEISAAFYGFPTEKLKLIGVTGTNGKTTVTNMIAHILESQGKKVGLIGTICTRIGDMEQEGTRTTPEALELQQTFAKMLEEGVEYGIMEVSSHALSLHRVDQCHFDVAVFTNLSQDHLDYHASMDEYCEAKTKLFMQMDRSVRKDVVKTAVINLDDAYSAKFLVSSGGAVATYGIEKAGSWQAENVVLEENGIKYRLDDFDVEIPISGRFNVYNSLAAIAVAEALGISEENAIAAMKSFDGVKGRFQRVKSDKDFTVIVDYAHTPDGLKNVLETAKEIASGRVITVFGCGGDRDKKKRPMMGEVAGLLSDYVIVTSDNPRTEEPAAIIEDILPGLRKVSSAYEVVEDRKEGILRGIAIAKTGDVVILAGKGHENYQEIRGIKEHFDDYEVALEALK